MQVFFSNIRPRIKHDLLTGSRIFTIPFQEGLSPKRSSFLYMVVQPGGLNMPRAITSQTPSAQWEPTMFMDFVDLI
jgi:hypothetical protein